MANAFIWRRILLAGALAAGMVLGPGSLFLPAADDAAGAGGEKLFNGKNLDGWKLRHPTESKIWVVVGGVKIDPRDPDKLVSTGEGQGVLFRQPVQHGVDLISKQEFGDCEAHCEFMVPHHSNSGFYLMGEYEVQILSDSYQKKDDQLRPGDCGGIYNTKAPSTQAETEPGTWQTYDIVFRAPRFDASGKKIEDARFVSVKFNGKTIQQNVDVPRPTGSELSAKEKSRGPIFLQGDHGVVAFRNIRVKEIHLK